MKLFQGPKGTYTHSRLAACPTVDVDFGQKPNAKLCVCDPRCLLNSEAKKKSDIVRTHTHTHTHSYAVEKE